MRRELLEMLALLECVFPGRVVWVLLLSPRLTRCPAAGRYACDACGCKQPNDVAKFYKCFYTQGLHDAIRRQGPAHSPTLSQPESHSYQDQKTTVSPAGRCMYSRKRTRYAARAGNKGCEILGFTNS